MSSQKQVPLSKTRGYGFDIKFMVTNVLGEIILESRRVNQMNYETVFPWASMVETLDAFVSNYHDKTYEDLVEGYRNTIDSSTDGRTIFRAYCKWLKAICKRLAKFKILPPISTSYAQGRGELANDDDKGITQDDLE